MKRIVVALEPVGNTEAIYVDGVRTFQAETVYAADIADAADGKPCTITQRLVDLEGEWPESEGDLVDEDASGVVS